MGLIQIEGIALYMDNLVSIAWWRSLFTRYGTGCGWVLMIVMASSLVIGFGSSQFGGRNANNGNGDSGNRDKVVAVVNGTSISQGELAALSAQAATRMGSPPAGPEFAERQGLLLDALVQKTIVEQEAKKRNVRASDSEIDKSIDKDREAAGYAKKSDSEWATFLESRTGMTLSEFREEQSKVLLEPALRQSFKSAEQVTEDEAKNQTAQVSYIPVFVHIGDAKNVTDEDARRNADALLATAKAGGDFAAVAKKSQDNGMGGKPGSTSPLLPEYGSGSPQFQMMGSLGYGKDFDEAVHKTPTGQITPVVKAGGFRKGYVFAKIVDRRNNLPKDFSAAKAIDQVKTQRAGVKYDAFIKRQVKLAKIEIKDPDLKAYYDFAKLRRLPQEQMMAQMSGDTNAATVSPADQAKMQADVDREFEEMLKRHLDDPTAIQLVADAVKRQRSSAKSPAESDQTRDRLIDLDQKILKSTEDRTVRFELADLYKEKKQFDLASEQYSKIGTLLRRDPPYDAQTMQTALEVHKRLEGSFRAINKPTEADTEKAAQAELAPKIAAAKAQEAAQRAKEDEDRKKASANLPGGTVTVPPGAAVTMPPLGTGGAAPNTPAPVVVPPAKGGASSSPGNSPSAGGAVSPLTGSTTQKPPVSAPASGQHNITPSSPPTGAPAPTKPGP